MSVLYLVDGSNFLFRAFHAMPLLESPEGVPCGAVRGFASMMLRLIGEANPTHLAVVFDAEGEDKRAERFPAYKQNRTLCPPELVPQFELAENVTVAMGLACLLAHDAEADDVIASVARAAVTEGHSVVIVSSDKDLMQLVKDGQIQMYDTMKEEGRGLLYDEAGVEAKWGVPPHQLGDVLALMGDVSDNLPGLPGVGKKTASQLILTFGSLDELIRRRDEVNVRGKDKIVAALQENEAQIRLVRELLTLDEHIQGLPSMDELQRIPVDGLTLLRMIQDLGFFALQRRLVVKGGLPGMPDLSEAAAALEQEKLLAEKQETARTSALEIDATSIIPNPLEWAKQAARENSVAEHIVPKPLAPVISAPAAPTPEKAPENTPKKATEKTTDRTTDMPWVLTRAITRTDGEDRIITDRETLIRFREQVTQDLKQFPLISLIPAWCDDEHEGHNARLSPLCGVSFCTAVSPPVYIPFGHRYLGIGPQLDLSTVLIELANIFTDPTIPKAVYGAKETLQGLLGIGVPLVGIVTDPALCSYLLDAGQDHELSAMCARHLGPHYPLFLSREAICQQGKHTLRLDAVELSLAGRFLCQQARATVILGHELFSRLDAASKELLLSLELPLSKVLAAIERHGICVDKKVLAALSAETSQELQALEQEIEQEAGQQVNLNSPKQLAHLLFDKLGLPPVKKTKGRTSLSVDAEVLETLAADFPIAHKISEYRSLAKLKGTYLDALPLLIHPITGRLHTAFQQVVAATGRLSSTDPNLQNIPVRSELGQKIRSAFVAEPGYLLISADYSQIELRVLAHLSQDPLLVQSFRGNEDVHLRTAVEMFGPTRGIEPDKRRAAKMINYGIVYGLTDHGLAQRLQIERKVAKRYIEDYFARYSGVKTFLDELLKKAEREGGARTLRGRFRPLPDLAAKNFAVRGYAQRIAKNTPIQGTAADILKQAMILVEDILDKRDLGARMLLTVHDELVLEAKEDRAEAVASVVQHTMEKAVSLSVPLVVDVGIGPNWARC